MIQYYLSLLCLSLLFLFQRKMEQIIDANEIQKLIWSAFMTRKVALLMIGVLFFNISSSCFPQLIDVQNQAKTDAENDVNQSIWFLLGCSACTLGTLAGYGIGTLIDPNWTSGLLGSSPSDAQGNGMLIGPAAGYLSLRIAIAAVPTRPSPERLLGKSPEYVQAYTKAYKEETQSIRHKSVLTGIIPGAFFGCLIVYGILTSESS